MINTKTLVLLSIINIQLFLADVGTLNEAQSSRRVDSQTTRKRRSRSQKKTEQIEPKSNAKNFAKQKTSVGKGETENGPKRHMTDGPKTNQRRFTICLPMIDPSTLKRVTETRE